MAEMGDQWLSICEICKYLGVSNDTVYKWIDKHEMPAHRMGRLWKFKKDCANCENDESSCLKKIFTLFRKGKVLDYVQTKLQPQNRLLG